MANHIGVINYGVAGNVHSISKAIKKVGAMVSIIEKKEDFSKIDKIVIPGVGSFSDAIKNLKELELFNTLQSEINTKPTLGICLGMQLLATRGFEYGENKGLNKFDAEVKLLKVEGKIPHMGFNTIKVLQQSALLKDIEEEAFYFMHSYELLNKTNVISLSEYSGHNFISSIEKEHIYGVQFHPEKSRDAGLQLFKNFIDI
jgi:imidazole glycerol phosphate synthase glutamine amidotransferase subunit